MPSSFRSPAEIAEGLEGIGYLADDALAMAVHLALGLDRPLLLEGANGVGKTEVAAALAQLLGRDLVRLQCYEGLDATQALYDWHYARQLLDVRGGSSSSADVFTREYLLPRPLLTALEAGDRAVLLIDEIDRADDEFEAFLLELLSDFAVTIPEIGRVAAPSPPLVVLTSNRTRDLHTALRRRCLYHWVAHPGAEREYRILRARAPHVAPELARQVADSVARIRAVVLGSPPGVGETIDWASALAMVGSATLSPQDASATLSALIKDVDDQQRVAERISELVPSAP